MDSLHPTQGSSFQCLISTTTTNSPPSKHLKTPDVLSPAWRTTQLNVFTRKASLAWQVNRLVFLCLLLSLFRFMFVFSSGGLCSTLGHKEWWFPWDRLDQLNSPTPVTCKLENPSPVLLGLVFLHCGWVPPLMMELRTCGHVLCILAEFPLSNRGCLTDPTLDLLCHSGLQPPARLAFNTRVCSATISSLGLLCLFVYGLSGEEKQILPFLDLT